MDFPGDDHVTQGFTINLCVFHSEPIPLTIQVWCLWVGVGVWELIPGGYPCPSLVISTCGFQFLLMTRDLGR